MDDPQLATQHEPTSAAPVDTGSPDAAKKSWRTMAIVLGVVVVAACLCMGLCAVAGGWGTVTGIIRVVQERDDVTAVLDHLMREMEQKDAAAAYALFSTRAQRQMPSSVLEELLEGNNYVLFAGYESVVMRNLSIKAAFNTNPDVAQGTIAEVEATVRYEGDIAGHLSAILELEDGAWRLHRFHITVPPDKMNSP